MDSEQREGERELAANPNDPVAMIKVISNLYHTQGTEAAEATLDLWYLQKGEAIHEHLQQFDDFYEDITTMVGFRNECLVRRERDALEAIAAEHGGVAEEMFNDEDVFAGPYASSKVGLRRRPVSWPTHIRQLGLRRLTLTTMPPQLIRLPFLLELHLGATSLPTIQGLPNFHYLSRLHLSPLGLANLEGLPELQALEDLDIYHNRQLYDDPQVRVLEQRGVRVNIPSIM